jgi:hypothetical protein
VVKKRFEYAGPLGEVCADAAVAIVATSMAIANIVTDLRICSSQLLRFALGLGAPNAG